jgi:AraC family transcriptional regulator of adaptative response/methylated-DNA-[protein]-cysteine methyltransferase
VQESTVHTRDFGKEKLMAGKEIREIYCWGMTVDRLHIYVASTKKGTLSIGLGLGLKEDCVDFFRKRFPGDMLSADVHPNRLVIQGVEAALMNRRSKGRLKFDVTCTPFQWRTLEAISTIPFGETRSYGEVANMVGQPRGARAIGQAMGRNPLPLIFP